MSDKTVTLWRVVCNWSTNDRHKICSVEAIDRGKSYKVSDRNYVTDFLAIVSKSNMPLIGLSREEAVAKYLQDLERKAGNARCEANDADARLASARAALLMEAVQ